MSPARILIAALCVVVCAWFVVAARDAHEVDAAASTLASGQSASPAALRSAASQLDAAAFLNPDQQVGVLRGRLGLAEHRFGAARRVLERVTRDEPMNLDAWILLVGASLSKPSEARAALAQIARLDPVDAKLRLNLRG